MIQLARFGISIKPYNVRSAALTEKELERYITRDGADVLRIANPALVDSVIDNIWGGSVSLADTGRRDPESCPPKPDRIPSYVLQQVVLPVPGSPVIPEGDAAARIDGEGEPTGVKVDVIVGEVQPPASAEEAAQADEPVPVEETVFTEEPVPAEETAPEEDPAPGEETAGEEPGDSGG
jgi:hypothetical protein